MFIESRKILINDQFTINKVWSTKVYFTTDFSGVFLSPLFL